MISKGITITLTTTKYPSRKPGAIPAFFNEILGLVGQTVLPVKSDQVQIGALPNRPGVLYGKQGDLLER